MKAFTFHVITLLFCHQAIAGDKIAKKCNVNEIYTTCGTACPLTCDNYECPPTVCTKQCIIGSVCAPGYVKNNEGNCVPPKRCKTKVRCCSGKHEEYNQCGSSCPLTCKNYANPPICTEQCVPGCYCKEGYVRNEAGDCVTKNECPKVLQCPRNEVYNECGTACPLTCKNYKNPPKFCTLNCVIECECKPGFVRNEENGKCVEPCSCPAQPVCKLKHEIYNTCDTACPLTCENYRKPPPCTKQCVQGCFCEPEYARNKKGNCVLPCDC